MHKKLFQITTISHVKNMVYIKSVRASIISTIIQIFLLNILWHVVYRNQPMIEGISLQQMTSYLVLSQAISIQFGAFGIDNKIASDIYNGAISFDLLKPMGYKSYLFCCKVGDTSSTVLLKWPVIFLVSFILFDFGLPASVPFFCMFVVSLLTGFVLLFYIEFIIGLLCFYTMNKYGVRTLKQALLSFLSGTLVPIYFLPDWMEKIVNILPFKYLVSVPASIYIGILSNEEIIYQFAIQIVWIFVMALLAHLLYDYAIRHVTVQGG